ncbi:MAG: hypothetical protein IT559_08130 [Alphaproteobacteria bacterium]|nr:hypothetical protein [Alphaproteobacteria bacterium]
MKFPTRLILSFGLLLMLSSGAFAQKKEETLTPATHMWVLTGDALVYVPVRSLEQCIILTRQAAHINSSTANCYNNEKYLRKIRCTKSTKKDRDADCALE